MNRRLIVAGTAGAAVTTLAITAVTWAWWSEIVDRMIGKVTIDTTGLGGDSDPYADAIERAARELAAVLERKVAHAIAEGGEVHGGRADLAAAGEGLGASLDLGGEVSGPPHDDGPLADRIRAKIAEIDADLAELRERQPSAYRKTSASHHIAGARIVLRQILAALDEQ